MKTILTLFISILSTSLIFAQTPGAQILFTKTTHDFGKIKESNGVQVYKFEFTNTGKSPLIINNVKASCGCTTPEWTKAPIVSGKSGYIKVSFDPINRPGPFNKSITINSNTTPKETKLHIKGIVQEREKTIDDKYTYSMDGLKLKTNHIALTKVLNIGSKKERIILFNTLNKSMLVEFYQIPKHISFSKTKVIIPANTEAFVDIVYNASKKNDWGFVKDHILITVNHNRNPKNRIIISADIQEDFSKMTEKDKLEAPKSVYSNTIFNFGEIKEGVNKKNIFKINNTGKSDLIIHKIKSSCGCTVAKISNKIIKAGSSQNIDVTFKSKGKSGKQHKTITIITNDPKNPVQILRVKGTVK